MKAMAFPVVMYECESWTIKKAKRQRIDALELWCWRRLLRVPWTARRSNQSILKEINPEYSLEGQMLKQKLRYFGHLMRNCLQCRRPGFNAWVGKIPCRREKLPSPVFWPGEFHGLYSLWGCKESDTTDQLSLHPPMMVLT